MTQTALFTELLEQANRIKDAYGYPQLCASHIAAAAAEFCTAKYTGFAFSTYSYPRYEDERLRYLFAKEVKLAAFFKLRLSLNGKRGVSEEAFDIAHCEKIAALRDAGMLSADILFLCALTQLHPSYIGAVRSAFSDEAIVALLKDTDTNIYDYVIRQIADILSALKKKSDEAAAIRDWKPAEKFAEPETLQEMFFGCIEKHLSGNVLTLKFPKFFGSSHLKLSIHKANDCYYIHDNGCAIRYLKKQVSDSQKLERILKKVCHPRWIVRGKMTGCFASSFTFFYYLQRLVFIANADLYYTKAQKLLCYNEKSYQYIPPQKAQPLDQDALLAMLKEGIGFEYEENQGLYCWMDAQCSLSSGRSAFLMETLPDGQIRISDRRKGQVEGEIFEQFYWDNDDLTPYRKFILKLASRFGAEFDGRDVFLTDKTAHFFRALAQFFGLATLISEFGNDIALPKIK